MKESVRNLTQAGQSIWLDYIRRDMIENGELAQLILEEGLRGMTSNPSIFEKAIAGGAHYNALIDEANRRGGDANAVYESVVVRDIQDAADLLHPVYEATDARDGYVSLEVSPHLAHDTRGTLAEARRLWNMVDRPNLMIKVPGTKAGIPAMGELITEGINVNVTLLFSRSAYNEVADTYVAAVERRVRKRADVQRVASVASFFVSRIDTAVDAALEKLAGKSADKKDAALALRGKIAIANAKLAYQSYMQRFTSERWKALATQGAQTQRVLWASTSTKNPQYRDVIYVEELIGADTVNTLPPATFDAFRDHGVVRPSLIEDVVGAEQALAGLERIGISLDQITDRLLDEGLASFSDSFDKLLAAIAARVKTTVES
ncbi:MAG TPA: transaldolase [Burkholderiales bacterium]